MNHTLKFSLLIPIILFSLIGCNKDEPLEHLPGTWTLSTVNVDGQNGTGTGTITFEEDLTGLMAITYMGGGIQITQSGSFTYTATNDNIVFNDGAADEFTWNRNENKNDVQEFEFVEEVPGDNYSVVLKFTK